MQYKLTVDINLMHEDPNIPAMDTLKRWKKEGKIDLFEADPPKVDEEPRPKPANVPLDPRYPRGRRIVKREPSHGVNFRGVAAVLFPRKDSQKLNMGEINHVAHLLKHHSSKNELFVTHNLRDFIDDGRRERLKAAFGIVAMTPDEVVAMLAKIEGWK